MPPGEHDLDFDKKPYWGGCRFQARRKEENGESEVLNDLEEWQVLPLFGWELPSWPLEGVALQHIHSALMDVIPGGTEALEHVRTVVDRMLQYAARKAPEVAPDPDDPDMPQRHKQALALLGEGHCMCAHVVERDVPEVAIEAGDLIVYDYGPDFPEMHGRVRYLSMDDYATLKAATFDSYRETFSPLTKHDRELRLGLMDWKHTRPEYQWRWENLYEFFRWPQKWGKRLKVWHSRLAVVRSSRSPVGEPIAALSDDGALFELIYSAGGRMPEA